MDRRIAIRLTLALSACLMQCLLAGCLLRKGNRVLIPDGYVGWVWVYYGESGAPLLQQEVGRYLIKIDGSGRVYTSSVHDHRYGNDEYLYVSSTGVRTPLKLEGVDSQEDDMVHDFMFGSYSSSPGWVERFFVGPRSAMKNLPAPEFPP